MSNRSNVITLPQTPKLASVLSCPWCRQPVESVRDPGLVVLVAEPVVCCHCHGIAVDFAGRLRRPDAREWPDCDWTEYRAAVRRLVEKHGPARLPLHPDHPRPPK